MAAEEKKRLEREERDRILRAGAPPGGYGGAHQGPGGQGGPEDDLPPYAV